MSWKSTSRDKIKRRPLSYGRGNEAPTIHDIANRVAQRIKAVPAGQAPYQVALDRGRHRTVWDYFHINRPGVTPHFNGLPIVMMANEGVRIDTVPTEPEPTTNTN